MTDRNTLLETALVSMPEGVAVIGGEENVVLWNSAAEAITGYSAADFEAGALPPGLSHLLQERSPRLGLQLVSNNRGMQIGTRHKLGHEVSVITRSLVLQNGLGEFIGTAVLFHPSERLEALPHGESDDDPSVAASQAEFEERLYSEHEDFEHGGEPLGVLWVSVDQGHALRKTHGVAACHAMLEKVQRALAAGLRPAEELARWGEDEFLILAHERTAEMLTRHAGTLVGLARTADFRWWGDRISLTVSIGAAQASRRQSLHQLLDAARKAMENSMRKDGNRVTCVSHENNDDSAAGEELICTPS